MIWKPLVICPDALLAEPLRAALADWQGVELKDYVPPETALEIACRHQCNVCFLDGGSQPDLADALVGGLAASGRPVVLLHRNEDGAAILRGFRHGAAEFLIPPFGAEETARVLCRLTGRMGTTEQSGCSRVYAFLPGKGSSGATTLIVNLAMRVAASSNGSVLLADFDLLGGSVAFQLNLKPAFSVMDALAGWQRMDEDLWSRMVVSVRNVDVLTAPEEPSAPPPDFAAGGLLEFWRKRYGYTLVDCPLSGGELTAGVARQADRTVVVATNDLAALHATRRALAQLERSGVPGERVAVVGSRCRAGTGVDRATMEKALGRPILAMLPHDAAGLEQPLLEGAPACASSAFGRAVAQLATRLLELENQGPATAPRVNRKIFSGWFAKKNS